MIDVIKRIEELMKQRNWTVYRLSEETGITQQTIHSWFKRKYIPAVVTLGTVCEAFNITMSELFQENKAEYTIEVTPQIKAMHNNRLALSPEEQKTVDELVGKLVKR